MLGIRFKPGEFPDEWMEWLNENLLRGVDVGKLASILASKGFQPQRNLELMHRLLTWSSLDKFLNNNSNINFFNNNNNNIKFDNKFINWIKETSKKGIDGRVIMKVLEDRCIDLVNDNLLLTQKLKNNEISTIKEDNNCNITELLDFFHVCKKGYYDDILVYCKCNVLINEQIIDRHTCQRLTAITYASMNGHTKCVELLLSYGADPNIVDMKGRSALHYAANNGYHSTCLILIEKGDAMIFLGDLQGNTSLHLATLNNHYDAVDILANQGLELTRIITSDKIKVKKNMIFDELVNYVYINLPKMKLKSSETLRFEKLWLCDAANYMHSLMDDNVKHMIALCSIEIMYDVLSRFDPRPESGIFISAEKGEQIFIKCINTAQELSLLLRNIYRQTALDSINNWKRTALHIACDMNQINSHENIIYRLINYYGCNVNMKDIHDKRPIDLLIKDKFIINKPSATQIREELLIDQREIKLNELFLNYNNIDNNEIKKRQENVLQECIQRDNYITKRLWHCIREGSKLIKTFSKLWEIYEDTDSLNNFYVKIPYNPLMGDEYEQYSWDEPENAKKLIHRTYAINYLIKINSIKKREYNEWILYECKTNTIEFFYNIITQNISFQRPKHLEWRYILRDSIKTDIKLGYGNEWEVYNDKWGNLFYKNILTRQFEYDKPLDAIVVSPAEMLCTAFQV